MAEEPSDQERVGRIREALRNAGLGTVVAALPAHVLLLTDYFEPANLREITTASHEVLDPLRALIKALGPQGPIGYEDRPSFDPASYAALHIYGAGFPHLLSQVLPPEQLRGASSWFADLRSVLTSPEQDKLRAACRVAAEAFQEAVPGIHAGLTEMDVAASLQSRLSTRGQARPQVRRAGGFGFCMSGPNAAQAAAAYQRTRARRLASGDFVLVHCNSYLDGFWTDVSRTFHLGPTEKRQVQWYDAIFSARDAALDVIGPGRKACDVDTAARSVLQARGLGDYFTHQAGHGVGFTAIDHNAKPRLHPASEDILQPGMVFNLEPAVYVRGYGGLRHCDMILVTPNGFELLTPFQSSQSELVLSEPSRASTRP